MKRGRTHLQFRRFAGCPICHLQLCSFADRHQEIADAGIVEVVLFGSPDDELRGYQSLLPFAVVADPDWVLYRAFGVETGLRAAADPRAWWGIIRGGTAVPLHRNNPDYAGAGRTHGTTQLGLPDNWGCPPTFSSTPTGLWPRPTTGTTPTTNGRWTNCWISTACFADRRRRDSPRVDRITDCQWSIRVQRGCRVRSARSG